jgi:O-acetyl-ADP-ribose deacetylase (regulator of RNase III)
MLKSMVSRFRRWQVKTLKPIGSVASESFQVSLGDLNSDVAHAMAEAFRDIAEVEVVCGNLLDLSCDAIVSPANSFGNMGGGIDKAIDDFHGGQAQHRVMAAIAEHFCGELPVGAAIVVEMASSRWSFVIASPTMRIPGSIGGTINAYLAMRAALVAVQRHNRLGGFRIRSLAIPGLGTGVGGLGYEDAAAQMRAAYDNVIGGKWQQIVIAAQAPYAMHGQSRIRRST